MTPPVLADRDLDAISDAEWLWQLSCLLDATDSHEKGRKLSFEIPVGFSHVEGSST